MFGIAPNNNPIMFTRLRRRYIRALYPFLAFVLVAGVSSAAQAQGASKVQVSPAVAQGDLTSLRQTPSKPYHPVSRVEHDLPIPYFPPNQTDGAVQSRSFRSPAATPGIISSVDGVGKGFTGPDGSFTVQYAPPDTIGAVGATQYVQVVNVGFAVFDKATKAVVYGPVATNTLWTGLGGGCENNNDGDAVVVYDKAANRWVVSQFSVSTTPYLECVAVSKTSDATGGWYQYAFSYGNTNFPDYPKMGVWPDGYYTSFNVFQGNSFAGSNLCAYDRSAMMAGNPATQQCFQLSTSYGGVLPSDLDGNTPPPAGAPNYLVNYGTNSLHLWRFHVDWNNSANTTLSGPINIPVATFTPACGGGGACIPQAGTTQQLDSLADRLMYRLAYRNFGDHESLVVNQSVKVGTSASDPYTGIRWYEIRDPGGTPSVYQQSTFSPDSSYRWMGSIAMDKLGDMALGYSVSDSSMHPAIRYAVRLAGDASNTMQAETSMIEGGGSQGRRLDRWGDYSGMTIDPVDDCTFWYTTEYLKSSGTFNWSTRIGSFKFPGCTGGPSYTVTPSVSGGNGTISPSTPQTVNYDATTSFTLTPSTGYHIASIGGTCGGSLVGDSYTTSAITANCTVVASFAIDTFTVTPSVSAGNGSISPNTPQTIDYNATTSFTVTPNTGYHISSVGGTCGGSLVGTTYTTSAVIAGCTVVASFAENPPSQLVFTTQPADGTAGAAIGTVTVEVQDAQGNPVVGDANGVTLTVKSGAGDFAVGSTTTVSFSNGVATFDNLVFDVAGSGYVLTATDTGDSLSMDSDPFSITPGTAQLAFTTQPVNLSQGDELGTIAVTWQDQYGNIITGLDGVNVDFSIGACGGTIDLGSAPISSGVATLKSAQQFYTVTTGLSINAVVATSPVPVNGSAGSSQFAVQANPDLVFSDGFESCRL